MTENLERPQVYGEYPPPFSVIQKERKLTFKRETLAKLELVSRKWSSEGSGCRTEGITFNSGVSDWYNWCSCQNECGKKQSYKWLFDLRVTRANQSETEKEISLKEMVIKLKVKLNFFYKLVYF